VTHDDVAIFEDLAEICVENPDVYGHVSFVIPRDELVVTLDMAGTTVALIHGHQVRGKGGVEAWWKGQALGRLPAGDADILINAHFHTFIGGGTQRSLALPVPYARVGVNLGQEPVGLSWLSLYPHFCHR